MASLHQNNSLATSEWGRCRYLDSWENRATRLRGMERELLEGQILPKSSSSNGKVGGNDTRKGPIVFEQTNKQTNNYSDIRAITFVQSLDFILFFDSQPWIRLYQNDWLSFHVAQKKRWCVEGKVYFPWDIIPPWYTLCSLSVLRAWRWYKMTLQK